MLAHAHLAPEPKEDRDFKNAAVYIWIFHVRKLAVVSQEHAGQLIPEALLVFAAFGSPNSGQIQVPRGEGFLFLADLFYISCFASLNFFHFFDVFCPSRQYARQWKLLPISRPRLKSSKTCRKQRSRRQKLSDPGFEMFELEDTASICKL